MQALQKFRSNPVSSSISFINGDDSRGRLQFPAMTICVTNFNRHLTKIMFGDSKRCRVVGSIDGYYDLFKYCLDDQSTSNTTTTTTEVYYGFGDLFGDTDDDVYDVFTNIDELMNFTDVEVYDVIKEFQFGGEINVNRFFSETDRKAFLKELWIKTYDHESGPCFTFDPLIQNVSLIPASQEVTINFAVCMTNTSIRKVNDPFQYYVSIYSLDGLILHGLLNTIWAFIPRSKTDMTEI